MKKIFYSMMAVALCACSQSDVDDNMVAPQPETNGLKITVVDNGFVAEDGTRVEYGEGTSAKFVNGDQIGLFVIKSMKAVEGKTVSTPNECTASNIPLTLTNGVWTSEQSIDLTDATLLFAYAPYNAEAITDPENANDWRLTFTGTEGNWEIDKSHDNRFFVGHELYSTVTSTDFDKTDWMGAVAKVPSDNTVTFNMQHMRGMVEVNTPKGIEISKLTLAVGGADGSKYTYTKPYHVTTNDKEVYRILTTEYNSTNAIYAQIKDGAITKNYMKALGDNSKGAGVRSVLTINYTPAMTITVGSGQGESLAEQLGSTQPTSLRLAGTLSETDWTTLKNLTALTTLDMSELINNKEIPSGWLNDAPKLKETLTTLILPKNLETIPWNSLQVQNVANIDIPATVKTIGNGAFYYCEKTSFCIPANSQLVTIGDGAFWNAKAVYTDAIGVLKMPASVTSIAANAFLGVKNLNKIIFQSTAAPEITNGGNQTIENNVLICVPNSDYKNKGLFPGNTVVVNILPLAAENYTAISTSEGGMADLCDGIVNKESYWHSRYTGENITYDKWGIYVDIALPTEQTSLKVFYANRIGGNNFFPRKIAIGVKSAETEEYTEVLRVENTDTNKPLAEGAGATTVLESAIAKTDNTSYKYVRFAILQANGVAAENAGSLAPNAAMATLAELMLAEDAWTE